MSTPRTRYLRPRRGMVPPATYGKQASTVLKTSNEDLQKTIRDLEEQVNKKAETKSTLSTQLPTGPEPKSASQNPALVPKLEYPPIASLCTSGSESSSATLTEHQPSTTASIRRIPSWLIPQIRPPILRSPLVRPEEAHPSDDYLVCIDRGEARVLKYNTVAEVRATFREPPELLPSGESRREWLASEEMDKTGMCSQYGTCGACWKRVYPLDIHTPMHFDYVDEWMDHRWNCWNLLARMDMKLKWKPANGEEEFEDFY